MYNELDEKKDMMTEQVSADDSAKSQEPIEIEKVEETTEVREEAKVQEPVSITETKTYELNQEPAEKKFKKKKKEKKTKKSGGGIFRKILTAACCGLCFGLFAGAGLFVVDKIIDLTTVPVEEVYQTNGEEVTISKVEDKKNEKVDYIADKEVTVVTSDYSDVVERVMPAMVSIENTYQEKINYWGQTFTEESKSSGSGIIIAQNDAELMIATNNHVVVDADKLEVTFIDGSVIEAQIKGRDADMDLAVITIPLRSIPDEVKEAIAIAQMGDSDALKLGEPVIAIGNALGYGQSVTGGYISALNREIGLSDGSTGTFIQTDAAINQGNSGGALLNINGEVIGINSNKIGGTMVEGMGYAIPITAAEPIIGELMNKEVKLKADKVGYIGIENPITVPDELVEYYNFPRGVFIRSVAAGSPADQAGILNNDIIVKFDGTKITTFEELQEELTYNGPGSEVEIVIMRQVEGNYVEKTITLTLGKRPDDK
ncbi:MAG: trypsin-like peptidase domain-containing protein [Lachnospiraceae bacterium]|nr:trypsin-like peptidase domain-containing protein [Lachnospiraceae bacterium]